MRRIALCLYGLVVGACRWLAARRKNRPNARYAPPRPKLRRRPAANPPTPKTKLDMSRGVSATVALRVIKREGTTRRGSSLFCARRS